MENLNLIKADGLIISNGKISAVKISATEFSKMSDKDLYKKCQEFGSLSLHYRRKFCGLLPEINRRQLHRKYGFYSIHEFASKLAGLSNDAVDKILNLDKKLEDKPVLQEKLRSGEIGYSKLRIVADIATSANQNMWAQKAGRMSKVALETFVREINEQQESESCQKTMLQQECPGAVIPACPAGRPIGQFLTEKSNRNELVPLSFKLSRKMAARLKAYRVKLERKGGKTLNWEDVFEQLLEKKQAEAQAEWKRKTLTKEPSTSEKFLKNNQKTSRHIPAAIKRQVEQRSEGICEYLNCFKPAEHFHHTERFALTGRHTNIRNLCKAHHELAHQGLIHQEEREPAAWKLQLFPELIDPKFEVDRAVRKFSAFR